MKLEEFLRKKKEPGNWKEIANEFNVSGSSKQKSDYVRRLWKKVNTGDGIHIVLGCVHVPYHNKILLNSLLKFIQDYNDKIVGFHLIGDFLDLESLSSHNKDIVDRKGITLGGEYAEGNKVLDIIEAHLPENIKKTYIYGNHEDRYFRYINDVKNAKIGDSLLSPDKGLKLRERGYIVKTSWKEDYVTIGKYQIFHGIFCTQAPAKSHITKIKTSCIFAHTHRIDEYYEKDLHGLNIGSFADFNSDGFSYLSRLERMSWKNGFAIVHEFNGDAQASIIVCNNNSFYYGGKKY